jgi:hypothetical protein
MIVMLDTNVVIQALHLFAPRSEGFVFEETRLLSKKPKWI